MERESLTDEAGRRRSWRLIEFPPVPLINVYMAGDVLIDAGTQLGQAANPEEAGDSAPIVGLGEAPWRRRPGRYGDAVESRHGG